MSYTSFQELNRQVLKEIYKDDAEGLWYGYRVFGVDGSTLRLPNSTELEEYFGRHQRGAEQSGQGPIVARISEVVELTTGIIVDAEIMPWSSGERAIAKEHIRSVTTLFHELQQPQQLFLFDRGYASRELMQTILNANANFMFRMQRSFNSKIDEAVNNGKDSIDIQLWPDMPTMRLIIRRLPSNEMCVLLTSIMDTSILDDAFFKLYWMRWTGCEEGYKKQKIALELENFSGMGLEVVHQEFWATVLAVNLFQIQCLEEEGAWNVEDPPKERINRSVVFGSLRHVIFSTIIGDISVEEFHQKFLLVARRSKIKVRPGRLYSRENVGKPKRHHVFRRVC